MVLPTGGPCCVKEPLHEAIFEGQVHLRCVFHVISMFSMSSPSFPSFPCLLHLLHLLHVFHLSIFSIFFDLVKCTTNRSRTSSRTMSRPSSDLIGGGGGCTYLRIIKRGGGFSGHEGGSRGSEGKDGKDGKLEKLEKMEKTCIRPDIIVKTMIS